MPHRARILFRVTAERCSAGILRQSSRTSNEVWVGGKEEAEESDYHEPCACNSLQVAHVCCAKRRNKNKKSDDDDDQAHQWRSDENRSSNHQQKPDECTQSARSYLLVDVVQFHTCSPFAHKAHMLRQHCQKTYLSIIQ